MTGTSFNANRAGAVPDWLDLQLCGELEAVTRHDAVIGVSRSDQSRRVLRSAFEIVIG